MQQLDALQILKTGVNVFLTGEPGAGKSHTIRQFVLYLRSCGVEPAITASTGIAATHIGGMTIHSWSGIGIAKTLSRGELAEIAGRDRVAKRIRATHTLIIDEVSMLSGDTLALVDAVCKTVRRDDRPFGGIQLVVVGDFFQLPPVSRFGEAAAQFAFFSRAWEEANLTVCYLSEQHRQEDAVFLDVLSSLRRGTLTDDHIQRLRERQNPTTDMHDITKLFPHNADVDRINTARLDKITTAPRSFAMHSHGAAPLVEQLRRGCLSPETLVLKAGARVMFTRNNFEDGFVNGTTGEVTGFAVETKNPIVQVRSGRYIEVQPETWGIEVDGKVLAAITQLPLRLAWAMTVHKSQGMSLDAAYVDLGGAFAFGQGYVALSRVRTLAGLHLGGLNARALEVDVDVLAKDEQFHEQSDNAQRILEETDAESLRLRQSAFIMACGGDPAANKPMVKAKMPEKKEKKGARQQKSLTLLLSGKTVAEVAKELGRTVGTIVEHLEKLKAEDKLPVKDLEHLTMDFDLADVHNAFRKVGTEFLKPAHEHLEGRYPYDTLRLARVFFVA